MQNVQRRQSVLLSLVSYSLITVYGRCFGHKTTPPIRTRSDTWDTIISRKYVPSVPAPTARRTTCYGQ